MRIVKEIEIEGKKIVALFDTGLFHTYVVRQFLEGVPIRRVPRPYRISLGGRTFEVKECCTIIGEIEGYGFHTEAIPIDKLGKVDGKSINAIIGAGTLEEWEILINPKNGALDLSGLKRGEFTEY
ncbi:MAG: hypothetical protein QMD71_08620 [bacterium]|nr:hypothetical protein [bacterium]